MDIGMFRLRNTVHQQVELDNIDSMGGARTPNLPVTSSRF